MTTIDTITDGQIHELRDEAGTAGDIDMIDTCDWALNDRSDNYYDSRRECARVIAEAEAQED
jgi:hypothetical protein